MLYAFDMLEMDGVSIVRVFRTLEHLELRRARIPHARPDRDWPFASFRGDVAIQSLWSEAAIKRGGF